MRIFKALLRGFKDLSDGSNTAILDIPENHIPDNPKEFRQKWGFWIHVEDFDTLKEGFKGSIDPMMRDQLIDIFEAGLNVLRSDKAISEDKGE